MVEDDELIVAGRRVGFCRYNYGAGHRVVVEYETPGTRQLSPQIIEAAADCELLVVDRSGRRATSQMAGRRVAHAVADVLAVTDTLGWDRFAVWGGSDGAPHALAVAAGAPDRVSACASVVGLAPFDAAGLDWFAESRRAT